MKKKLEQAIKSSDIKEVRSILLEMVTSKGGNISTIEDMTEAISSTPDLFDKDDGKLYAPSAKELTSSQIETLREDIKSNFSIPKFKLLAEVQEIERTHPAYFKNSVKDTTEKFEFPDGETIEVDEHVVDDDIVTLEAGVISEEDTDVQTAESAKAHEVNESADSGELSDSSRKMKKSSATKKVGYIMLIIGLATSITGLCVSINFMLGLGIGLMMIAAAMIYFSINRRTE